MVNATPSLARQLVQRAVKRPIKRGPDCYRHTTALSLAGVTALVIGFSTLSLSSVSAIAADDDNKESNWYLGAAVGNVTGSRSAADYKNDLTAIGATVNSLSIDDSRTGWKFNVGFDVSQSIAIEAGYLDLNDVSIEGSAVVTNPEVFNSNSKNIHPNSADGFTLGSKYSYNVSRNFGLTGSVGLFSWDGDFTTRALAPQAETGKDSNSGTDIYFGVGGGYQLFDDVTLSIEWERYKLDKEDAEVWSIGVDYHFK